MTGYIEFDYDTNSGKTITVHGKVINDIVKFTVYNEEGNFISKSVLPGIDIKNIEEFILDNAEEIDTMDELDER
jgi:hypothetical protein